jgi:hypothetical protein
MTVITDFVHALTQLGRLDDAASTLASFRPLINVKLAGFGVPELVRVEGELWAKRGEREAAQDCFQRALGLAHAQGARLLELRAAIALTQLERLHGKGSGDGPLACEILRDLYAGFVEGRETRDLVDARRLLQELGVTQGTAFRAIP